SRAAGVDAGLARWPQLRRRSRSRNQVSEECARPGGGSRRSHSCSLPCTAAASAGSIRGAGSALLVVRRCGGDPARVQPDREYLARLIETEAAFWQRVLEK